MRNLQLHPAILGDCAHGSLPPTAQPRTCPTGTYPRQRTCEIQPCQRTSIRYVAPAFLDWRASAIPRPDWRLVAGGGCSDHRFRTGYSPGGVLEAAGKRMLLPHGHSVLWPWMMEISTGWWRRCNPCARRAGRKTHADIGLALVTLFRKMPSAPFRVAVVLWMICLQLPSRLRQLASKYECHSVWIQRRRPESNEQDQSCSLFLHRTIRNRSLGGSKSKCPAELRPNGNSVNPVAANGAAISTDAIHHAGTVRTAQPIGPAAFSGTNVKYR